MKALFDRILRSIARQNYNQFSSKQNENQQKFLIGPYLGEIGFEIGFLLAALSPWFRAGWKIIARRPELYPEDTAFHESEIFAMIDDLLSQSHILPYQGQLRMNNDLYQQTKMGIGLNNKLSRYSTKIEDVHYEEVTKLSQIEINLRKIIGERVLHDKRPQIFWDDYFYRITGKEEGHDFFYYDHQTMLAPFHKPPLFEKTRRMQEQHIGFWGTEPSPESSQIIKDMTQKLELKVIYYLAEETKILARQQSLSLLAWQLMNLKNCALMLVPNGDGLELMAWLQIPTIVQKEDSYPNILRLQSFQPTMCIYDNQLNIDQQFQRMLTRRGEVVGLSENYLQSDQTKPIGLDNPAYW